MGKTLKDRKTKTVEEKEDRRKVLRLREEQRQNKYRFKYIEDEE